MRPANDLRVGHPTDLQQGKQNRVERDVPLALEIHAEGILSNVDR
jgi:hypothetical protein